jgi:hypothetical protein
MVLMGLLSRMMSAIVDMGFLSGFSVGSKNIAELIVSHLLFVDDTLIIF